MIDVDIQIATACAELPEDEDLDRWLRAALAGRRDEAELAVRLVDEPEGRELNATYRGRDYATNVLSFPADLPAGVDLPVLGDLVICAPVVEREAAEQGKALDAHWAHMIVHGVLHLLGYDHIEDDQAEVMETEEREILAGLGYPDPYVATGNGN
ncbi:MAG TPA: rRNA maturation RNase YbeY [Gammaproteobacteria bacterium]|nr:rRNA maturation RNase YbeY [Gammaproteobacteria bacterium]